MERQDGVPAHEAFADLALPAVLEQGLPYSLQVLAIRRIAGQIKPVTKEPYTPTPADRKQCSLR